MVVLGGYKQENGSRPAPVAHVGEWMDAHPGWTLEVRVWRPTEVGGAYYLAADTEIRDGVLWWTPTAADTAIEGKGRVQIWARDGEKAFAVSELLVTQVLASISTDEQEPPTPMKPWLDKLVEQVEAARGEAAASAAEAASTAAGIVTDEAARQEAEGKRVKAEEARETAETNREQAEAAREKDTAAAVKRTDDLVKSVKAKLENGDFVGAQGPQGVPGTDGADGAPGQDGKDGLDAPQIDDTTVSDAAPWSSQHIVDMLCPPLEASGNPVVCYPVAGSKLGVTASWEPTQEGSGEPYPAGGGKNLLNPANYEAATKTVNGITYTRLDTGEVTVKGTATGTAIYTLVADFAYTVSISTDGGSAVVGENVISVHGLVSGVSLTRPSDNTKLYIRVASGTTVNTTIQPQLEKGSTATAYAPYANIRPIHGRDSVKVERCGENLLPESAYTVGLYNIRTPQPVVVGKGTYTLCTDSVANGIYAGPNTKYNSKSLTFTMDASESIVLNTYFTGGVPDGTTHIWLVAGSEWVPYSPYVGSTTTLTLPNTIYGGEVGADGEGQETWKLLTLTGDERWGDNGSVESKKEQQWAIYGALKPYSGIFGVSSHFGNTKSSTGYPFNFVRIADTSIVFHVALDGPFATIDAWKSYLAAQYAAGTPVQIAYEMITPQPFTATGGGAIKALSGTNTVLTDADALTVTGRADPIHIIQQLQAASAASAQALADVERAVTDI